MSLDDVLAHTIYMNEKIKTKSQAEDNLLFFPYTSELDELISPEIEGWNLDMLNSLKRGDEFLKTHDATYYQPGELIRRLTNFFSKSRKKKWKGIPENFKKSFVIFSLSFHMYYSILSLLDKEEIDEEKRKELQVFSQNILRKDFESIYKWKDKQKELADLLREVTDNSYLLVFNFFDIVESYMGIYPYLDELIELIKLNDSTFGKGKIEDPYVQDLMYALESYEIDDRLVQIVKKDLKSICSKNTKDVAKEVLNYLRSYREVVDSLSDGVKAAYKELLTGIQIYFLIEARLPHLKGLYREFAIDVLNLLKEKRFAEIVDMMEERRNVFENIFRLDNEFLDAFLSTANAYIQRNTIEIETELELKEERVYLKGDHPTGYFTGDVIDIGNNVILRLEKTKLEKDDNGVYVKIGDPHIRNGAKRLKGTLYIGR